MATLIINEPALRRWAKRQGIDGDRQLAEQLGVHRSTLQRVLRGQTAPSPQLLARLVELGHGRPGRLLTMLDS